MHIFRIIKKQLATPPLGGGEALQFPMKIRYRELKRAFMDNQDDNFMDFFHSVYFKLFIATSGPLFPDFRSPSSKRPGKSKYFEPGKALGHF